MRAIAGGAKAVDSAFDRMVDTRRTLHRRPELALVEHGTTSLVRDRLTELGLEARPGAGDTGAVGLLQGGRPGGTVLLRADVDALPLDEQTGLEFSSEVDGVMHACGHDAHTACLLGVAEVMARRAEDLPGRYLFAFQPAEEQFSGARAMVEAGLLDATPVDAALCWHVAAPLPAGLVAVRPGIAASEGQGWRIALSGAGGHAGHDAQSAPSVLAGVGKILGSMGAAVAGLDYDATACVCSAGLVQAGTAMNVIPARAVVEGSLRTFLPEQHTEALSRLRQLVAEAAAEAGVEATLELTVHAPPVFNDAGVSAVVVDVARQHLGPNGITDAPLVAASDDMSEILSRVPGCYFWVGGGRPDGRSGPHHSSHFDIDEESMRTAAVVLSEAAVHLAAQAAEGL